MTREDLKTKTKEEVLEYIRQKLSFDSNIENNLRHIDKEAFKKEHKRFEMSGYESNTGECTTTNLSILNEFANLGIYDYTTYLFLDFYKGNGTLYLQYWGNGNNEVFDEYGGWTTSEIIYAVFEKTIFSDKSTRRRD